MALSTCHKNQIRRIRQGVRRLGVMLLALTVLGGALPVAAQSSSLASGLNVAESGADGLVLSWRLPEVDGGDLAGGRWDALVKAGATTVIDQNGVHLPVFGGLLAIPAGVTAQVQVTDAVWEVVVLDAPLAQADTRREMLPGFGLPLGSDEPAKLVQQGLAGSLPFAQLQVTPVRYDPDGLTLTVLRSGTVRVTWTGGGASRSAVAASWPDGSVESMMISRLLNPADGVRFVQLRQTEESAAQVHNPPALVGGSFKLTVDEPGIYGVTGQQLAQAGLTLAGVNPLNLQVWWQGRMAATELVGMADGRFDPTDLVRFYIPPWTSPWQTTQVAWLSTQPTAAGLVSVMGQRDVTPTDGDLPWSTSFPITRTVEENHIYDSVFPAGSALDGVDHWFWQSSSFMDGKPDGQVSGVVKIPVLAEPAQLRVSFQAYVSAVHQAGIRVNGVDVGVAEWNRKRAYTAVIDLPRGLLHTGDNTVTVGTGAFGVAGNGILLDKVEVVQPQPYLAEANRLAFPGDLGTVQRSYVLRGFDAGEVLLYDVADPFNPQRLMGAADTFVARVYLPMIANRSSGPLPDLPNRVYLPWLGRWASTTRTVPDASGRSLGPQEVEPIRPGAAKLGAAQQVAFFTDKADALNRTRSYVAVHAGAVRSPSQIVADAPSNWQAYAGADYLIISHADFVSSVQPLAIFRRGQGLSVVTVNVADLYDEFSGGNVDPEGIRQAIGFAYANWPTPPRYVLLVGDGTYDFKNFSGYNGPTFLPPYLAYVDPWLGEVAADNRYAAVAGDDLIPDVLLGRIPAQTPADVTAVVNKTIAYEQQALGAWPSWKNRLAYVTDNAYDTNDVWDGAGDFIAEAESVIAAQPLPAGFENLRYFYDPSSFNPGTQPWRYADGPTMKAAIQSKLAEGLLLASFIGHSSQSQWASERFVHMSEVATINTEGRLPVILEMTCLTSYFNMPDRQSLDEVWVTTPTRGAVATVGPSGFGVLNGHGTLHYGMNRAIFADRVATLGDALLAGKIDLAATGAHLDLLDTFMIMGDPALGWHLPN